MRLVTPSLGAVALGGELRSVAGDHIAPFFCLSSPVLNRLRFDS